MDNEELKGRPESAEDAEAKAWLDQLLTGSADVPAQAPKDDAGTDLFDQFVSPMDKMAEIGTDEHAVAAHDMKEIADMELDKIIQEADGWDLDAIERENMESPIESAFDEEPPLDEEYQEDLAVYADGGTDPDEEGPVRKVRPKRKNGYGLFGIPHVASLAIWLAICITVGVSFGRLVWIVAADVLALGRPNQNVEITVAQDDDLDSVCEKLKSLGLIKYPGLFKIYAGIAGVEVGQGSKISFGTFTLNTQYDYHALVSGMSSGSAFRKTLSVTIPEGYTCRQIFALLEEQGICTVEELETYSIEHTFDSYWFLENAEKGTAYTLEGYLFPDTYEFYIGSSAREVYIKLLAGFDARITDEMKAQLDALNETLAAKYRRNGLSQSYIDEHMLTMHDVIIVASMIEKETAYSGESQNIASVIYNRLTDPFDYPNLDIDATIVYALGGKTDLTLEDLAYDSPYNTYLYEGLPPGPISNPGVYSIKAALDPNDTNYYFYALDTSGESFVHVFFRTYAEQKEFLDSLK